MSRAGRKKKPGVKRINGRISQRQSDIVVRTQETEREATATARGARQRLFNAPSEDAMDRDFGTVVGRLRRQGVISAAQLKAARTFEALRASYIAGLSPLVGMPAPARASQIGVVRGRARILDDDVLDDRMIRYDRAIAAVMRENSLIAYRGNNLLPALDHIVIRDMDFDHMHGDLRLALNALQHHFKVGENDTLEVSTEAA